MFDDTNKKWVSKEPGLTKVIASVNSDELSNYGDLSCLGAYQGCWEFIHGISVELNLGPEDLLIRTLAIIDKKIGKRRL